MQVRDMTGEELDTLCMWLKTSYPKKYKSLSEGEMIITKDNFSFAYEKQSLADVMAAYRFFLDKSPFEPTTSEIKQYIAERIVKTEEPVSMDDLPEHHYMRGRYIHAEAFNKAQADRKEGIKKPFSWYVEQYPSIEWQEWVDEPPVYWQGIEYKGWEKTRDGFIKPIGARNKSDLTVTQLGFKNGRS